jgi:hypothetical protein
VEGLLVGFKCQGSIEGGGIHKDSSGKCPYYLRIWPKPQSRPLMNLATDHQLFRLVSYFSIMIADDCCRLPPK